MVWHGTGSKPPKKNAWNLGDEHPFLSQRHVGLMLGWKPGVHMVEHDFPCETDDFVVGTMDNHISFSDWFMQCVSSSPGKWKHSELFFGSTHSFALEFLRVEKRIPSGVTVNLFAEDLDRQLLWIAAWQVGEHLELPFEGDSLVCPSTIFATEFHQIKATAATSRRTTEWILKETQWLCNSIHEFQQQTNTISLCMW
jgi:hypothetical protein